MKTLMRNGRDRRSDHPQRATRGKNACFCLGPISGSHQGPQPERLHSEAGYMAAPERFAQPPDSPLAPRAPSIHGTKRPFNDVRSMSAVGGEADMRTVAASNQSDANDPTRTSAANFCCDAQHRRLVALSFMCNLA